LTAVPHFSDKFTAAPHLSLLFAFEFPLPTDWKLLFLRLFCIEIFKLSFRILLRELTEYSVETVLFLLTLLCICCSFTKRHTANKYFP
jgi:hypothetical protein